MFKAVKALYPEKAMNILTILTIFECLDNLDDLRVP